jgi:hypothetical protein
MLTTGLTYGELPADKTGTPNPETHRDTPPSAALTSPP